MRRTDSLYARRDYDLDSGLGDTHFNSTTGDLAELVALPKSPNEPVSLELTGEPELVIERLGLGYLVYIRHDLTRYGVDGYGKRVYSKWRAGRYGRKLMSQYRSTLAQ